MQTLVTRGARPVQKPVDIAIRPASRRTHDRQSRFDFVAVLGEPGESIIRGSVMQLL
jgi:hypothetical protein